MLGAKVLWFLISDYVEWNHHYIIEINLLKLIKQQVAALEAVIRHICMLGIQCVLFWHLMQCG